jgi:hypothetical protein
MFSSDRQEPKTNAIEVLQRLPTSEGWRIPFVKPMLDGYFQNSCRRYENRIPVIFQDRSYAWWHQLRLRDGPDCDVSVEQ